MKLLFLVIVLLDQLTLLLTEVRGVDASGQHAYCVPHTVSAWRWLEEFMLTLKVTRCKSYRVMTNKRQALYTILYNFVCRCTPVVCVIFWVIT